MGTTELVLLNTYVFCTLCLRLHNVLEDFRDMDATALEETKATVSSCFSSVTRLSVDLFLSSPVFLLLLCITELLRVGLMCESTTEPLLYKLIHNNSFVLKQYNIFSHFIIQSYQIRTFKTLFIIVPVYYLYY